MQKNLFFISLLLAVLVITTYCKKEELPELSTYNISGITINSAVSGGVITSDGGAEIISRGICWSPEQEPVIAGSFTSDGSGQGSFISNLVDLTPATKYYVRAYATNAAGTQYGQEVSFTTLGNLPQLTGFSVTDLTITGAVLHGTVNPGDLLTDVSFEYGTSTDYGSSASAGSAQLTGNTGSAVSVTLSNLLPGTVYHYRIKASNQLGNSFSADQTFTTPGQKPSYMDFLVKAAGTDFIKLGIKVNPNYLPSSFTVEYGTSETYGNTYISTQSPVTGNAAIALDVELPNLLPGTNYHFRIKLENALGITYTEGRRFKTYNAVDADENGYYSVMIGTQEWLSENLKTTHFSNGEAISNVTVAYDWSALTSPGYCTYKNEEPGIYGNLYNFYAASDSRNVCPAGWHVPTLTELNTMIAFLGGEVEADKKIREAGLAHWLYNTGATNSTGLTLLPAGNREGNGDFMNRMYSTYVWSSTTGGVEGGMNIGLEWNAPKIYITPYGKSYGASIRCLKD